MRPPTPGNPFADLDPSYFPSLTGLPDVGGTVPSIALNGEPTLNAFVIGGSALDVGIDPTLLVYGNVGCSTLCGHVPSFNYRDGIFTLDAGAPPAGLGPEIVVPFTLEGGDLVQSGQSVASRVIVTVDLEGNPYEMMLDTGATNITVSQAAFDALTADGRVTIDRSSRAAATVGGRRDGDVRRARVNDRVTIDGVEGTVDGTSTSKLTRAATVGTGGVVATGPVIVHDSSFDMILANISTDVGHTIDGSLGGTFLENFYVTIDYANGMVHFAPYNDPSFILDQGRTIGITLDAPQDGGFPVLSVTGDAATKGIEIGDLVIRIDDVDFSTAGYFEAVETIYGAVGTTKMVTFGNAAQVSHMTVPLVVDEALPLPGP